MNFNIFYFDHIARLHHDAALFRYAPANPQIDAGLRADKRHVIGAVLHNRGGHVHINVIVMIVGRQHGVDLANSERIENKRGGAQVGLELLHAGHTLHLVAGFHQRIPVALLAGTAPEIDADIGSAFGFQPDARTTQPPHRKGARRNLLLFNFFIQPATPFRKSVQDP